MASFNISYIFNAIDKLSPVTQKINQGFNNLDSVIKKTNVQTTSFTSKLQTLANKSNFANNSIVQLAAGYLSLNSAIGFGKSLINTQVQLQNINAGLKAVTGSQAMATEEFNFARKAADEIGVSFEDLILPYTKFLAASKMSREENRKVFTAFNQISRVFGLTGEQTAGVFRALEQMQSKGKVMSEELKLQLGDRLPGAFNLFAEAAGVSTAKFTKLLENGRIGAGILKRVADVIQKKYGDAAIDASNTLGASLARLNNKFFDLKNTTSTGFFSKTTIDVIKFLANNMETLFKVAVALVGIFGVFVALKIPVMLASMVAQFILSTTAALGLFKVLTLFALTNPFGQILLALGVIILSSKKFREDFVTVLLFIKNVAKDVFGWIIDSLGWIIDKFKIVGDFFGGITDKIRGGVQDFVLGENKINTGLNNAPKMSFIQQTLGLEGIINIKGAPAGSTAEMSTFGNTRGNLGLNMSFTPGGI